jgi:hypothetical protein
MSQSLDVKHNHMTRDIKKLGVCPACDNYHVTEAQKGILLSLKRKVELMEAYSPTWNSIVFRQDVLDLIDEMELWKLY